jgi:hypothetical protein
MNAHREMAEAVKRDGRCGSRDAGPFPHAAWRFQMALAGDLGVGRSGG